MSSIFTWVDFAEDDRRKMADVIALFAPSALDYEVVGAGHEPRAEDSLEPEHLPSQHEPAHVDIRQQG